MEELNQEMDGGGGHVTFYDSALNRPVFEVTKRPLSQFLEGKRQARMAIVSGGRRRVGEREDIRRRRGGDERWFTPRA